MLNPEISVKKLIKRGAVSAAIIASSSLFPANAPKEVDAQESLPQAGINLLYGDGSKSRLNILLLPYNGTTDQMLQEVAQDIFFISPTDEFKDQVNVYSANPTEDLKCDQLANCDWDAFKRQNINLSASTGLIFHEVLGVVKSLDEHYGNGNAFQPSYSSSPDRFTPAVVVRPETAWRNNDSRIQRARDIAHELWGHSIAGFGHEGGDLMDVNGTRSFNIPHTQFIRELKRLIPWSYAEQHDGLNLANLLPGQMRLKAGFGVPRGATQMRLEVIPANNDGPGVQLLLSPTSEYTIPEPEMGKGPYVLLPDMTYTWRLCASGLFTPVPFNPIDSWKRIEIWPGKFIDYPCKELTMHTPKTDSSTIKPAGLNGEAITSGTPTLKWTNTDLRIFYYEVQLSRDATFNTNPETATASVLWNLVHGGESKPLNSWTVPDSVKLSPGKYFWRVRPRVQGDGQEVAWSETWSFDVAGQGLKTTGFESDKNYGNGVIGPSQADIDRFNQ